MVATVSVAPDLLNPLSEQTAVIDQLTPWTAYNVTVLCFTSPGDGQRSAPELVRTFQASVLSSLLRAMTFDVDFLVCCL